MLVLLLIHHLTVVIPCLLTCEMFRLVRYSPGGVEGLLAVLPEGLALILPRTVSYVHARGYRNI